MKQDRVVPLYRADGFPTPLTGAKAQALARLHGAGHSVPDGVCVTSRWFGEVSSRTDIGRSIEHNLRDLGAIPTGTGRSLELIRRALTRTPWPDDLVAEVSEAARRLLAAGPVMVRSSVPVEDGAGLSFAGVFESEGPLESVPEVLAALARCWAALYSARVLSYSRGQLPGEYAAFLQSWVRPDAHGVLFTRNPVTHADGPITDVAWGARPTPRRGAPAPDASLSQQVTATPASHCRADSAAPSTPLPGKANDSSATHSTSSGCGATAASTRSRPGRSHTPPRPALRRPPPGGPTPRSARCTTRTSACADGASKAP
ncbi:PEP/pyruvate-binding domain-containing protein [Streptomyces sp. NPDC059892]|uniref:PEP/pyruvate-binding domain-containing protein n=1 Tax=Streptomyces sp. NPDC059892 TaxID=3346989 RepID=UPI00366153D9